MLIVAGLGLAFVSYLLIQHGRAAGLPTASVRRGLVYIWLGAAGVIALLLGAGRIVGFNVANARSNEWALAAPLALLALGLFLWVRATISALLRAATQQREPTPPQDDTTEEDTP